MPEYSGSALFIQWISSAGTITVSGDYRQFNDNPEVELLETTAGADADKTFISGVKSGKCSLTIFDQTGASGTLLYNSLAAGMGGTLVVGAQGTVAGSPKRTIPAISQGAQRSQQYNSVTEISCDFQYNGAAVNASY